MPKYKIVKADNPAITSNNSRELKRRIKSGTGYKYYTDGVYNFCNKAGDICFKVEYTTTVLDKNTTTLKGRQFNTHER